MIIRMMSVYLYLSFLLEIQDIFVDLHRGCLMGNANQ